MAWGLVAGINSAGEVINDPASGAERMGAAIGATLGVGMVLSIWVMGGIILGLMMLFTRGKKIVITKEA